MPEDEMRVALAHRAKPVATGGVVNIGGHHSVYLPSEATQRRGFSLAVERAKALLTQFPDRYKVSRTGGKSQQAQS